MRSFCKELLIKLGEGLVCELLGWVLVFVILGGFWALDALINR